MVDWLRHKLFCRSYFSFINAATDHSNTPLEEYIFVPFYGCWVSKWYILLLCKHHWAMIRCLCVNVARTIILWCVGWYLINERGQIYPLLHWFLDCLWSRIIICSKTTSFFDTLYCTSEQCCIRWKTVCISNVMLLLDNTTCFRMKIVAFELKVVCWSKSKYYSFT